MKKIVLLLLVIILIHNLCACRSASTYSKDISNGSIDEVTSDTTIVESHSKEDTPPESSVSSQMTAESNQSPISKSTTSNAASSSSKQTTTSNNSQKPQSQSTNIKNLLNSAPLEPLSTNTAELDNLVNTIFSKIHTSGMTTYDRVKACYDYLVNNCTYDTPFYTGDFLSMIYSSYYDETMVRNAYYILSTGRGVCDNYSAAFAVMCRRIGLNAHVMGGTVSKKGGGRTGHAWSYIILNGTEYIFDPQVQSNNKNISYYYFGKTYAQMGSTYQKDSDWYSPSDFAKFQCHKRPQMNMQLTIEISGYEALPFTSTHRQEGTSTTLDLSGCIPIVMKENGTVDIAITPSGGSGKYILGVLAINGDTGEETVAYQKEVNGTDSFTLNCNAYSTIANPCFAVVLFDALNESSYVVQEGIRFITSVENQKGD